MSTIEERARELAEEICECALPYKREGHVSLLVAFAHRERAAAMENAADELAATRAARAAKRLRIFARSELALSHAAKGATE